MKFINSDLKSKIISGDRQALARGITLVESSLESHKIQARNLVKSIMSNTGQSVRIGISGPPGAGKSTLIESFGLFLLQNKRSLSVLAVDPSSNITGGSILGDKTRMEKLSSEKKVFIRPSPSSQMLGGVARNTREAILLCEAAGFDTIIVETVGVGQSEAAVANMVDIFILVISPGGGDELQGLKRGIVELADIIVVNKADGNFLSEANLIASEYGSALSLLRRKHTNWKPKITTCSALNSVGMNEIWYLILAYRTYLQENGGISNFRINQLKSWLWEEIKEGFINTITKDIDVLRMVREYENNIDQETRLPPVIAQHILSEFLNNKG